MASTNKTTNYNLSQFEGTDKPSWEADYNADMLAIDTNLKAVSDVADGASGNISTLADRVTMAEGNITTNANDIDALEARADALESGETIANGRLDALEAEQIVQNTAIESNTRLGYNLARPYDSASTYAVGAYVLFQDTLYKCTTAVSTGEAFDPNKWLAIKATDEIAAGGYTLPIASANDLGGVKIGGGLSIDAVTGILSTAGGSSAFNFVSFEGTNAKPLFVPSSASQTIGVTKWNDNTSYPQTVSNLNVSTGYTHLYCYYNDDIIIMLSEITTNYTATSFGTQSPYKIKYNFELLLNSNFADYNAIQTLLGNYTDYKDITGFKNFLDDMPTNIKVDTNNLSWKCGGAFYLWYGTTKSTEAFTQVTIGIKNNI